MGQGRGGGGDGVGTAAEVALLRVRAMRSLRELAAALEVVAGADTMGMT